MLWKTLLPLYLTEFFMRSMFVLPIWILFFQSRGLTLVDIGFVSTGTYIASVLLEYPSGIFADRYGRKNSLLIAIAFSVLSFLVEIYSFSVTGFFVSALLNGASWAFTSGAREALIFDLLKSVKSHKLNSVILGRLDAVGAIGSVVSVALGSVFYKTSAVLPYWLTIISAVLGFLSLLFLKEPKYSSGRAGLFSHFKEGVLLVFSTPVIKSLLLLYVPLFFFEEAWYNASQPILVGLSLPVVMLGLYSSFKILFSAIGGLFLPLLLKRFSHFSLFAFIVILEASSWLFLGSDSLFFVIIFSYVLLLIHQLWVYVDGDAIHKHIPSRLRASVLSGRQTVLSILFVFNPWLMGWLVNTFPRSSLFGIFAGIVLVLGAFVLFIRRRLF
ncbi:MFS transporter [Candidatus Woesearchaeota archaeon]|nr:MFS transporter [Candidatus Woesearchaeota archaeon]